MSRSAEITAHRGDRAALDSLQLKIGGMSCSFCVSTISKAARRLDGVSEAAVNLAHEEALVRFDADRVSPQQIVDAIRNVGYTVRDPRKIASFEQREAQLRAELNRLRVAGLVTTVGFALMVAMWAGVHEPIFPWIVLALALIQVFVVGRPILAMAIPSLRRRILNQHVLLEFGALGGLLGGILGFFTTTFSVPDFLGATLFITSYHLLSGYTSGYLRTRFLGAFTHAGAGVTLVATRRRRWQSGITPRPSRPVTNLGQVASWYAGAVGWRSAVPARRSWDAAALLLAGSRRRGGHETAPPGDGTASGRDDDA